MHVDFWPENMKERELFADLGIDKRIISEGLSREVVWKLD
jgi:hypothetical protein